MADELVINGETYVRLEQPAWLESKEVFLDCVEETYGESPCELNLDYDLEWDEYSGEAYYDGEPCAVLLIDGDVYVRADRETDLKCPRVVAEIATEYFPESIADPVRRAVWSLGYGDLDEVETNKGEILAEALKFTKNLDQFRDILYALSEEADLPRWLKSEVRPEDLTDEEKKVLAEVLADLNVEEEAPGWLKRWVRDNLDKVDLKLAIAYDVPESVLAEHFTKEDLYEVLPWAAARYVEDTTRALVEAFGAQPEEALTLRPLKHEALRAFLEAPEWQTFAGRALDRTFVAVSLASGVKPFTEEEAGYVRLGDKTVAAVTPAERGFYVIPLAAPPGRNPDYTRDRFFHRAGENRLVATVHGLTQSPPVHPTVDPTSLLRPDLEDLYQNWARDRLSFPPNYHSLTARPYRTEDWAPEDLAVVLSLWPALIVPGGVFVNIPEAKGYAATPPPTRLDPVQRQGQELLSVAEMDREADTFLVLDEEGRVVPTVVWDRAAQRLRRNPKIDPSHPKVVVPAELLPGTLWVSETFYV